MEEEPDTLVSVGGRNDRVEGEEGTHGPNTSQLLQHTSTEYVVFAARPEMEKEVGKEVEEGAT